MHASFILIMNILINNNLYNQPISVAFQIKLTQIKNSLNFFHLQLVSFLFHISILSKYRLPQLVLLTTALAHVAEHALLLPELPGGAKLGDAALGEDEDAVKVGDGAQAVGNHEQGAVGELLTDAALDEGVGGHVDGRGGLVQHHDLGPGHDGAREAEELALALREVAAGLGDGAGQVPEHVDVLGSQSRGRRRGGLVGRCCRLRINQVDASERVTELLVGVVVKGVEV